MLTLLLLICLPVSVRGVEKDMTFAFDLTIDGKDTKKAETGDILTIVLKLRRTDSQEAYTMYAMQDEIRYDSRFFELVPGSMILGNGIVTADIQAEDHYREIYMNYLSSTGGNQWNPESLVGSFQLRVIGNSGISLITNEDYLVSVQDGTDSYDCQAEDVTVVLSEEVTVRFDAGEGISVPDQTGIFGQTILRPADPVRQGYVLEGWYTDNQFTRKWDFDQDTVQGNLILYAKWEPLPAVSAGQTSYTGWVLIPVGVVAVAILLIKKKRKQE